MPQIGTGGAERQLLELITNSDPEEALHEVFYYSDAGDREMLNRYLGSRISCTRVHRNNRRPIRFLCELARAIRRARPDIVHCWLVSGNFWGRWGSIAAGTGPIIVAWRNCHLWKPLGMRVTEKLTTSRVHHVANSLAVGNYMARELGIPLQRFTIIPNGIQAGCSRSSKSLQDLLPDLRIPTGFKVVTMVGRLNAQKNYPMLLRVAKEAKVRRMPVRFLVVGRGEEEFNLARLAQELDVADAVHFLGLRGDVQDILAASDIFLFTSSFEGFPNALLEAMAAGLPVVATSFSGVDELISGPDVGRVVALDDDMAACEAIGDYVADWPHALAVGQGARSLIEQKFGTPAMVDRTINLYRDLLGR